MAKRDDFKYQKRATYILAFIVVYTTALQTIHAFQDGTFDKLINFIIEIL